MKNLKEASGQYFKTLKDRAKKSRVYKPYQLTGLTIAEILSDERHKSLYIKLAKLYDNEKLISIARDVAERKTVVNRGAYFMKVLKATDLRKYENVRKY